MDEIVILTPKRFTGGTYEEQRELSEREKVEAKAIAAIRIDQMTEAEIREREGQNSGEETPLPPKAAGPSL